MKRILSALVTLVLLATPVLATDIDTFFYNDGPIAAFHETLMINEGNEGVTELIVALDGELTVVKNIDSEFHRCGFFGCKYRSVNEDKLIIYDPEGRLGDLSVEKVVWWGDYYGIAGDDDGGADVYREAVWPHWSDVTHAGGIGEGVFVDSIDTPRPVTIYQSVGLDQFATCEMPVPPQPPSPPVCTWCV